MLTSGARSPRGRGAGLAGNCSRRAAARAGAMAKLLSCVLGPRLYKIYRERDSERAPSGVPETPASVTAPPPSSWVSRALPPWRHGTARAPLRPCSRKRPLSGIGGACLSSQLRAQSAWCFRVKVAPWAGRPGRWCRGSLLLAALPAFPFAAPPGREFLPVPVDAQVLRVTLRGSGADGFAPNSPCLVLGAPAPWCPRRSTC